MTRRDLLMALFAAGAVPRSVHGASGASRQSGAVADLVLCGWDEVFILEVGDGASPAGD